MYLKVNNKYSAFDSELAKSEKNDCVVRSVASAAEVTYKAAHDFCKDVFGREDKRGTNIIVGIIFFDFNGSGIPNLFKTKTSPLFHL